MDPGLNGSYLVRQPDIAVTQGSFTLSLCVDCIVTITTNTIGVPSTPPAVPPSPPAAPFPLIYEETFDGYPLYSPPRFFSDMSGEFEIANSSDVSRGQVLRQVGPL